MTCVLEKASSELKAARFVVHKLGETFDSFQAHSRAISSLADQWRTLQSSFSDVHKTLESRVHDLETKERECSVVTDNLESLRKEIELKREKVEVGEKSLREEVAEVELRRNEVRKGLEMIEEMKRGICEREKAVEAKETELLEGLERVKKVDDDEARVKNYELEVDEWRRAVELEEIRVDKVVEEVDSRDKEIDERCKAVELRESGVDERCKEVELRENRVVERFKEVELRENEVDERCKEVELRENGVDECRKEVELRENEVDERCKEVELRENEVDECRKEVELRENEVEECRKEVESRENRVDERLKEVELRENRVDERLKEVELRENRVDERLKEVELRENRVDERLKEVELSTELVSKENELKEREKVIEVRETRAKEGTQAMDLRERDLDEIYGLLELRENEIEEREKELKSKETRFKLREEDIDLREGDIKVQCEELKAREKDIVDRLDVFKVKDTDLRGGWRALKKKENEIKERFLSLAVGEKEVEMKERGLNDRRNMLELKGKEVDERDKALELKEEEVEELRRGLELKESQMNADLQRVELKQNQRYKEMERKEKEKEICAHYKVMKKKIKRRKKALDLGMKQFEDSRKGLALREKQFEDSRKELELKEHLVNECCEVSEQKESQLNELPQVVLELQEVPFKEVLVVEESKENQRKDGALKLKLNKTSNQRLQRHKPALKEGQSGDKAAESRDGLINEPHKAVELKKKQASTQSLQWHKPASKEGQSGDKAAESKDELIIKPHKAVELNKKQANDTARKYEVGQKQLHHSNGSESGGSIFTAMDGKTLQLYLNERAYKHEFMKGEIVDMLKSMPKPAKIVLDAIDGFFSPDLSKDDIAFEASIVRSSCLLLLEHLMNMKPRLPTSLKKKARAVGLEWRANMLVEGESEDVALAFLLLLVTYKLTTVVNKDELRRLCGIIDHHRLAPCLRQILGLLPKTKALKKKATEVALEWRANMWVEGESEDVALAFLMLLVTYNLTDVVNKDDLRRLFGLIEHHTLAPRLGQILGLLLKSNGSSGIEDAIEESIHSKNLQTTNALDSSPVEILGDIHSLCRIMDEHGVRSYLIDHVKEYGALHDKILDALRDAPDPSKLVLSVCQICVIDCDKNYAEDTTCIFLLKQLMILSPSISKEVTNKARKFASFLKARLKGSWNPVDHYRFLQFLVSYKLADSYDSDELLSYFKVLYYGEEVYRPEDNACLCSALGLVKKIPGVVKSLINQQALLSAVQYICVFNLELTFPPVPLLETHLQNAKKAADQKRKEGNFQEKIVAESLESMTLKSILTCISNFKLESKFSPDRFLARIIELDKENESAKIPKKRSRSARMSVAIPLHQEKRPRVGSVQQCEPLSDVSLPASSLGTSSRTPHSFGTSASVPNPNLHLNHNSPFLIQPTFVSSPPRPTQSYEPNLHFSLNPPFLKQSAYVSPPPRPPQSYGPTLHLNPYGSGHAPMPHVHRGQLMPVPRADWTTPNQWRF